MVKLQRTDIQFWRSLCDSLGVWGESDRVYYGLLKQYETPIRHYHNIEHIRKCLSAFDDIKQYCHHPDYVEMAIWYHDIIYDFKSLSNEADSAKRAAKDLSAMWSDEKAIAEIQYLIMDTTHRPIPDTPDGCIIADIDLSSLGSDWESFKRDSDNIRSEFNHLSDEEFREGRRHFITWMLERGCIYYTGYFHSKYEDRARENLTRALKEIDDAM